MRRWLTALALLAPSAVGQEAEKQQIAEEEEAADPLGSEGRIFRGELDAPAVLVRLREGGTIQLKAGEEWKETTLDDLGTFLANARDEYDLAQRKIGKSGIEEVSPGVRATRLFLSIDGDPTVPWQHIQWIMTVAAEEKYRKLEMSEGARKLLVSIPVDRSVDYSEGYKPPPAVKAPIHLLARNERPARWGDLDVLRPTEVRCKCGDTETTDLAEVTAYLRKAKKAAEDMKDPKVIFYGQIRAGHKVPYAKVFDVMETFVAAEIRAVDFWGTAIPPKALRKTKRLPYPAKNCETAD